MSIDAALLDILCCPLTQVPLQRMPEAKLARLNELILLQCVKNESKVLVDAPLEAALMTRDGKLAYPIRGGVPVLLIEQGIALTQCE